MKNIDVQNKKNLSIEENAEYFITWINTNYQILLIIFAVVVNANLVVVVVIAVFVVANKGSYDTLTIGWGVNVCNIIFMSKPTIVVTGF